jgi:hypothetical protein
MRQPSCKDWPSSFKGTLEWTTIVLVRIYREKETIGYTDRQILFNWLIWLWKAFEFKIWWGRSAGLTLRRVEVKSKGGLLANQKEPMLQMNSEGSPLGNSWLGKVNFLFYSGNQWIGWSPATLCKAICFTQIHWLKCDCHPKHHHRAKCL